MGLSITENDLLLFKYLFECGFLKRDQIRDYVWSYKHKSSVKKRLWRLTKEGFLKKVSDPLTLGEKGSDLMATEKAKIFLDLHSNVVKKMCKERYLNYYDPEDYYTEKEGLDLRQYRHDRDLNTLRLYLENRGARYWVPGCAIRREQRYKRYPDGVFVNKKKTFAVEVEYNLKSKYVLKKIFKKYRSDIINNRIDYVLYITKNKSIGRSMVNNFHPEMINNYVYVVEDGKDENGDVIKKEAKDFIYKHFFVSMMDYIILKDELRFQGNKIKLDLKDAFR